MSDMENQMGLFEAAPAPVPPPAPTMQGAQPAPKVQQESPPSAVRGVTAKPPVKPHRPEKGAPAGRKKTPPPKAAQKGVSGLVPEGDVRLTANIRQDLHLKLKIASAYRRTTIGEILEELIEKYV